jgi:hypothetical protein
VSVLLGVALLAIAVFMLVVTVWAHEQRRREDASHRRWMDEFGRELFRGASTYSRDDEPPA